MVKESSCAMTDQCRSSKQSTETETWFGKSMAMVKSRSVIPMTTTAMRTPTLNAADPFLGLEPDSVPMNISAIERGKMSDLA